VQILGAGTFAIVQNFVNRSSYIIPNGDTSNHNLFHSLHAYSEDHVLATYIGSITCPDNPLLFGRLLTTAYLGSSINCEGWGTQKPLRWSSDSGGGQREGQGENLIRFKWTGSGACRSFFSPYLRYTVILDICSSELDRILRVKGSSNRWVAAKNKTRDLQPVFCVDI